MRFSGWIGLGFDLVQSAELEFLLLLLAAAAVGGFIKNCPIGTSTL